MKAILTWRTAEQTEVESKAVLGPAVSDASISLNFLVMAGPREKGVDQPTLPILLSGRTV